MLGKKFSKDMKYAVMLVVTLVMLIPAEVFAESELEIELALDKPRVELGQHAKLTVTVSGPSGFSEPAIPPVDGLEIVLQGRTQSVQIINMKVKSSKLFLYAIAPSKIGEFTIGPVQIRRQGKIYESDTVDLRVEKSVQAQAGKLTGPKNVIVEAGVDNVNPYVGQQITLLFRFAQRPKARIRNAGYQLPSLEDFWKEGAETKREYRKNFGGIEYLVTEVMIPLFPTKEGDITIEGLTFHYEEELPLPQPHHKRTSPLSRNPFDSNFFNDDFFRVFNTARVERRIIHTEPIELHVRSLPLENRPAGFKGGVGSFKLDASLSEDEVKVGESVTLTVKLNGLGNIRDLADPEINIENVKTYSDIPILNVQKYDDNVMGEKIYKFALVPQQAEEIGVPKISVPYFNPKTERYESASSAPLRLRVFPSEEESLIVTRSPLAMSERKQVPLLRRDILPIHERLDSIETGGFEVWWHRLRPVVYPLPLLVYGICLAVVRHREKLRTDVAYRRERSASKVAQAHIDGAVAAMKGRRWEDVFGKCSHAVTEYLADKLNVPAGGLTPADVESALLSRGISKQFVTEVVGFLESCDYGRFASSVENAGMADKHIEKAKRIIARLEHEGVMKP
jgi:hypothetical protein